jgi:hypothetical protein
VRRILCLAIILASCAWADETSDRASIERVISVLGTTQQSPGVFTADFENFRELNRLGLRIEFTVPTVSGPTVVISDEPWGEATLVFPGVILLPGNLGGVVRSSSHLVIRSVRFVTPDVAVLDVTSEPNSLSNVRPGIPALFVMKRDGADWKIASVRLLSQG